MIIGRLSLGLTILLAFMLRFYQPCMVTSIFCIVESAEAQQVPPSLNWDEVSIGYNAYSIYKTGYDEWGQFLPVHFKSYGEYKLPGQVYASIPGIAIFGLNNFGVRITPVIYGTLSVLLMFFLARAIFQSFWTGVVSAFLLAISPWHIHLTRGSFESSFATFWLILAVWLFVLGFKSKKWLIISMIPFAASVFTYNSARLFTPFFLLTNSLIYKGNFKREIILAGLLFTVLLFPLLPFVFSGAGSARYKLVSITDDPGLLPRINEQRGLSILPDPLPRLIHNKVTYVGITFLEHYLAHFTPDFLFVTGAPHKQHHVQNIGQLYLFQAPFLIIGFFLLFRRKQKFRWLILSWLLLSYIPVATTNDSIPHALRTLIAVPVYQLISGYGFICSILLLHRYRFLLTGTLFVTAIAILVNLFSYLQNYYYTYPILYSRDWQYGYQQVVDYIGKNQDKYDQIVFTRHYGEPHMFTLFYLNYDPRKFQTDPKLNRFETYNWVRVLNFDKFYFPDLGDKGTRYEDIIRQNHGKKLLFIGKHGDFPANVPKLFQANFLNGNPAFEIVEYR